MLNQFPKGEQVQLLVDECCLLRANTLEEFDFGVKNT